mmetsp:Transcript_34720/g.63078  ORF Transcript_34720/g.63078 Transcript_34720/m.63078 type:complete len:98 (+) Transcript_34720:487-780(+)
MEPSCKRFGRDWSAKHIISKSHQTSGWQVQRGPPSESSAEEMLGACAENLLLRLLLSEFVSSVRRHADRSIPIVSLLLIHGIQISHVFFTQAKVQDF